MGLGFVCYWQSCLHTAPTRVGVAPVNWRGRAKQELRAFIATYTVVHQHAAPVNRAGAVSTASRAQQEPATTHRLAATNTVSFLENTVSYSLLHSELQLPGQ